MKAVIAIPIQPVKKAGAKTLHFKSMTACAKYFQTSIRHISYLISNGQKKHGSFGYTFDVKDGL